MKTTTCILLSGLLSLGLSSALFAADKPVRVLLITGQNNHNWKETTPLIVEALEATKRFEVEVTEHFEKIKPEDLKKYDVLFSHWNLWRHRKKLPDELKWSDEMRKAYLDFVKSGGGHVTMHAGSSTFFDWDEYQQVCVATWKKGTHHGPQHEFEVRIEDQEHPVTKGLGNFKKWDELWEKIYVTPKDATVLTSSFAAKKFKGDDVWEKSTVVSTFGEGRTAYTAFGHDKRAFDCPAFRVLLARLVEWAATGRVTIPPPDK